MRAVDSDGLEATSPDPLFDLSPFRFSVGSPEVVFADDFEVDRGWTHSLVSGNDILGADDWQRGAPRGRSGDPHYAFSGTSVWGNDLGEEPFNGAYQPGIRNRLESPVIDCRDCGGTRLQFRRWLGVEAAAFDVASVWVNGRRVWTNPVGDRSRDREWRFEDVDISSAADGKKFRVRFELQSDAGIQLGGWNLDDVKITRDGDYEEPGSCACSLSSPAPPPWGAAGVVALMLASVLRRRRS
jgi:MYXO-CTERM domain-containing protein